MKKQQRKGGSERRRVFLHMLREKKKEKTCEILPWKHDSKLKEAPNIKMISLGKSTGRWKQKLVMRHADERSVWERYCKVSNVGFVSANKFLLFSSFFLSLLLLITSHLPRRDP